MAWSGNPATARQCFRRLAVLDFDHPAVITTSDDGSARIWDPHHPDTELARFDGHTAVWGVATIAWPDFDHPAVITTFADGTARIWDPHRAKELMGVPVFGTTVVQGPAVIS